MTAHAHNAPKIGYYKFTAAEPAQFPSADKFLTALGLVRISSSRIRPKTQDSGLKTKSRPCPKK
jgi:hypothetical protein